MPEGHTTEAFVGVSRESEEGPATLEGAIHDAAVQAVNAGFGGQAVQVCTIEFVAEPNPHITQYRVIAVPGGS